MFRFRRKGGEEDEPRKGRPFARAGRGKAMLETVRTGLNSQWFRSSRYSILKEFEITDQRRGLIEDKSRERAVASILGSLERAVDIFTADNDQEGLKDAAGLILMAYIKIGDPTLIDKYTDVCAKAGMTEEEIIGRLLEAADGSNQIDIAITLYSKARVKEKLIGAGNRALGLYLESDEMDMNVRSRLFDYVVEAYRSAGDKESLIHAGDKALESQIGGRRLSREKEWVLDAQKAYEAAGDKGKLARLADQYVNLYLKEGLETWLDKAIAVYEEAEEDYASKLGRLADRIEERGRSGIADTLRRKAGLS